MYFFNRRGDDYELYIFYFLFYCIEKNDKINHKWQKKQK